MIDAAVHAEVVGVTPSLESVDYASAVLIFRNGGPAAVRVRRYRVVWDGGSFTGSPRDLVLAAGGTREWRVRIDHSHGNVDRLLRGTSPACVDVLEVEPATS